MTAMEAESDRWQETQVTHVNIDRQPDAVKNFFTSLSLTPEGSLVELNGRPVVRVMPAPPSSDEADETEWTPAMNHRRCDLVDKRLAGGLTPAEDVELARLTAGLRKFVNRVAPVPLDEVRKLHQQLLEKAAAAESQA